MFANMEKQLLAYHEDQERIGIIDDPHGTIRKQVTVSKHNIIPTGQGIVH